MPMKYAILLLYINVKEKKILRRDGKNTQKNCKKKKKIFMTQIIMIV